MSKSLKELVAYWFISALQEFLDDKELKIPEVLTYFPPLDEIRDLTTKTSGRQDSVSVITFGRRKNFPQRRGPWQKIVQFGEYEYYLYSTTEIPVEFVLYTVDEDRAEQYLDFLEHFLDDRFLIAMQGENLNPEPDYLDETFTYVYYDDSKWNSFRIKDAEWDLVSHEGDLYEISVVFIAELHKMLAVRYPAVDYVNITGDISGSGSGTYLPIFGSGGNYDPSTEPIKVVFHIDDSEYNVI